MSTRIRAVNELEQSIAHWDRNSKAKHPDEYTIGASHCALCSVFNTGGPDACRGCPVMKATGQSHCKGTPYRYAVNRLTRWYSLVDKAARGEHVSASSLDRAAGAARSAARVERNFLKSLRERADDRSQVSHNIGEAR